MKSYLRFLSKNKLYTAIEVLGLALSLAFVVYVGCFTAQQYQVAYEHPDCQRIYMAGSANFPGLTWGFPGKIRDQFPEIESVASYYPSFIAPGGGSVIEYQGESIQIESEVTVDQNFFRMFPKYRFLMGGPEVLAQPDNVIVSESFARKLFPDGNFEPVNLYEGMRMAAVVEDFDRTIFPYTDVFMSEDNRTSPKTYNAEFDQFGSCIPIIRVREDADIDALYEKLEAVCREVYPQYGENFLKELRLERLDRYYFVQNDVLRHGDKKLMLTLSAIALLLLFSAVANFVNLNTALVGQRAKEMATRRLVGLSGRGVLGRYFGESVSLTFVAMVLALVVAQVWTPWMNRMIGADIPVEIPFSPLYLLGYALLVVLVGGLSAILPAMLAAHYQPIDIVRGNLRKDSKRLWNKVFIVVQTAVAVFLISMALVMQTQFGKSLHREMQCDIEDKFCLFYMYPHYMDPFDMESRMREMPMVSRVGRARSVPCTMTFGQYSQTVTGEEIMYRMYVMDSTTFDMMGFRKVMDFDTPLMNGVWFTESAFRATGFTAEQHDISTTLAQRNSSCSHVAGVIRDVPFNLENIGSESHVIVAVQDLANFPIYEWIIETKGDHEIFRQEIQKLAREYTLEGLGYETEPYYCDYLEDLKREALSKTEKQMSLIYVFMGLAVLISVLGFLAMSIYDAHSRARDIAVRKVFGSSALQEARDGVMVYMKLIAVACVIGLALAIWVADLYLQQFVVKIQHYGWIFFVVILITVLITLLSTIWQIWSAVKVNPVETLNKE